MRNPRARYIADRTTSREGARHVQPTLGLRCRAVLNVILARDGASIAEIAHELAIGANEVSGRIANLRDDLGIIEDSGIKRASVTPVRGIVWKANAKARDYAQRDRSDSFHTANDDLPLFANPATRSAS